jgi:hypothetical protein
MPRTNLTAWLVAALLCAGCESRSSVAPGSDWSGPSTLSGIITTSDGLPVQGAVVSVRGATATSNASGRYEFDDVVRGPLHIISVEKAGFRFGTSNGTPAEEVSIDVQGRTFQDFLAFVVPRVGVGDAIDERVELTEPRSPAIEFVEGEWLAGTCAPCQMFLVDVVRPGHLFVTVSWQDEVDLALWVTGQPGPKVGRQTLTRDIPVDGPGIVECYVGGANSWGWKPLARSVDVNIRTSFYPG